MVKRASDVCPECYGKKLEKLECVNCVYLASCRFFFESSKGDTTTGSVNFDKVSFSSSISTAPVMPDDPEEAPEKNPPARDLSGTLEVLEFLLDIDNYTAELLSEVLRGANSTEELASKFGKSRQAIHRKLVDCCTEHPELRQLFISRLYKCRRLLSDSARLTKKREAEKERKELEKQIQPELF
jgi:predicted DNA-binding protein YlxM (UPF0122 family)